MTVNAMTQILLLLPEAAPFVRVFISVRLLNLNQVSADLVPVLTAPLSQ